MTAAERLDAIEARDPHEAWAESPDGGCLVCDECDGVDGHVGPHDCGHNPDPDRLIAALRAVLALADRWEHGALRWADPLPVPPYVALVRDAITVILDGAA
jgi:hypothetical protein